MNIYSIDTSIFKSLYNNQNIDGAILFDFYKCIRDLHEIIVKKQPRRQKYFLFSDSIDIMERCISFIEDNKNKTVLNKKLNEYTKSISMDEVLRLLDEIKRKMPKKIFLFEEWFDIEKINLHSIEEWFDIDKINLHPISLGNEIPYNILLNSSRDHFAVIAAFNKYIYKNCDKHQFILSNNIVAGNNTVTAELSFVMKDNLTYIKDDEMCNRSFRFKYLPLDDIKLKNQDIKINKLVLRNN